MTRHSARMGSALLKTGPTSTLLTNNRTNRRFTNAKPGVKSGLVARSKSAGGSCFKAGKALLYLLFEFLFEWDC